MKKGDSEGGRGAERERSVIPNIFSSHNVYRKRQKYGDNRGKVKE